MSIDLQESRDEILLSLGYHDYENYLSRALWKRIKQRVLERDDWMCRRCNGKALLVHHRSYSRAVLEGLDDSKLASICEGCHHIVEFRDDGSWRSPEEEDEILLTRAPISPYPVVKVDFRRTLKVMPVEWERMDWWQRTGWGSEYNLALYSRRALKHPETMKESSVRLMEHFREVVEAVRNRTTEATWRSVPDVTDPSKPKSVRRFATGVGRADR
ncbi:hypothetical protein G3A43_07540 [Paraburkholderia aspalathi]|nr:hypothetical protein [Paraburkholderia aspalathi]MBK3780107.1 hypothetical protein [Paraburkholderia aspalathi]